MKSSKIFKQLKSLGYETEEEYGEYQLVKSNTLKTRKFWIGNEIGETEFQINFDKDTLRNCCGVLEIGNFDISANSNGFEKNKKLLEVLKLFIQWMFLQEKERTVFNKKVEGIKKFKPVIFCSNGRDCCVHVENALNALPEDFIIASKSVNPGTGSTITMYVSY
jgi:hypothetical protein